MSTRRYAFARADEATHPDSIRATISEFFATLIFVFAGEGSVLALGKLYGEKATTPSGLLLIALAHALSLASAVSPTINISGGHVNPAVTFAALITARISLLRSLYYWIAQLLGAVVASLLLRFVTNWARPIGLHLGSGVDELHGLLLEIVLTFGLIHVVYSTAIDPKRGEMGSIAPLSMGPIY